MTRSGKLLFLISMFFPFGCSRGADASLEKQAAGLLLERYETVVSARSRILSQLYPGNPKEEFGAKDLRLPFASLLGGLKAIGPNVIGAVEGGSDTILTGARDFVRPEGLGGVNSRRAHIAILAPGTSETLAREFSKVRVVPLDGRIVWTWSIPPSEGYKTPTDFYAAIVSSFFVLTNNLEDFREVTNALAKAGPAEFPSARNLTALRTHAYWAYRAIRRPQGADTLASGLSGLPASAVALELFTEYEDGKLFFSILVPDDRSSAAPSGLPSSESIHFQKAGPGLWQAAIDLNTLTPRQKTAAVFQVMAYFGYGVFL